MTVWILELRQSIYTSYVLNVFKTEELAKEYMDKYPIIGPSTYGLWDCEVVTE